jgi:hypothetical protein
VTARATSPLDRPPLALGAVGPAKYIGGVGLGLRLRAAPRVGNPLEIVERCLRERCRDVLESLTVGEGRLAARLHPAAEDVEFSQHGPFLVVDAKTSTVGAGYHVYLCDLLHALEVPLGGGFGDVPDGDEPGAGDETGYFTSGALTALEDEMLAWLGGVAGAVLDMLAEGSTGVMVSMSTDTTFEFDGAVATPLGPRTEAWLRATHQDPRAGVDIFAWWQPGNGAQHATGRALSRMWSDVRWRHPVDDDEVALLEKIDADLRRAHELDPALPMPWAEWAEILELLGRQDAFARRVSERGATLPATIGYRRRPVRVALTGGWTIRIPGEMSSSFDEEGTWCGFVPGRTIWMSSLTFGDPETPTRSAAETLPTRDEPLASVQLLPFPDGYAARASVASDSEGNTALSLEVARPHRIALFTFIVDAEADLAWARAVAVTVR